MTMTARMDAALYAVRESTGTPPAGGRGPQRGSAEQVADESHLQPMPTTAAGRARPPEAPRRLSAATYNARRAADLRRGPRVDEAALDRVRFRLPRRRRRLHAQPPLLAQVLRRHRARAVDLGSASD